MADTTDTAREATPDEALEYALARTTKRIAELDALISNHEELVAAAKTERSGLTKKRAKLLIATGQPVRPRKPKATEPAPPAA